MREVWPTRRNEAMRTATFRARLIPPLMAASMAMYSLACSADAGGRAAAPVQMQIPAATPPRSARASGAEVSCSRSTLGRPVDPSTEVAGVTGAAMLAALTGTHPLELDWRPWWQAPPAVPDVRRLSFDVNASATPYTLDCPLHLAADAVVHMHDDSGAIDATFIAVMEAWGPLDFALHGEFQAPQLAAALELPAAAPDSAPDAFVLAASLSADAWRVALGSRRPYSELCELMVTAPLQDHDCSAYVSDAAPSKLVSLSSELSGAVIASDLLGEFKADQPRYVHWRDGSASALQLSVTPRGFACVGRAASDSAPAAWTAVVPVDIQLASADRRLRATLPGAIAASAAAEGWRGTAALSSLLVPAHHPVLADAMLGFDPKPDSINLLSFSLRDDAAIDQPGLGSIGFAAFKPAVGLPEFPAVLETTPARASCFAAAVGPAPNGARIDETR
jgi:hypothetical protein